MAAEQDQGYQPEPANRWDFDTSLWGIHDPQYNDEFYVLGTRGEKISDNIEIVKRADDETVLILQEVNDMLPNHFHDETVVRVVPFKDDLVDFTDVMQKTAVALEGIYAVMHDNGTIDLRKRSARIMCQLGLDFDIVPAVSKRLAVEPLARAEKAGFQDSIESFDQYGPIEHEPDIPTLSSNSIQNGAHQNGGNRVAKPQHFKSRLDPKIDGQGLV